MGKRPDLLAPIALWEFISAVGVMIPIVGLTGMMWFMPWGMSMGNWWGSWEVTPFGGIAVFILSTLVITWVLYLAIAVAGGIGLLQGREWGRVLSIVHAALSMLWIPIGTIIGVLVIIYLVKTEVREYFT